MTDIIPVSGNRALYTRFIAAIFRQCFCDLANPETSSQAEDWLYSPQARMFLEYLKKSHYVDRLPEVIERIKKLEIEDGLRYDMLIEKN